MTTEEVIKNQNSGTNDSSMLNDIFTKIAKTYGYRRASAEYTAHKDFKIVWKRTFDTIDFQVSDYIMDAPECVLESLATTICSKITNSEPVPYTKEMMDWVTSDDFIKNKQPIYLRRSRNIAKTPVGETKNLEDSWNRLKEKGLIKENRPMPYLTWTRTELLTHAGYYSSLMNVIAVSSALDIKDIPDDVVDYVVYYEYIKMMEGLILFGASDYFNSEELLNSYPNQEKNSQFIFRLGLNF